MINSSELIQSIESNLGIDKKTLENVVEGKVSETFFFTADGKKQVLRITDEDESYRKDKHAAELFAGTEIPVPPVSKIGLLKEGWHYAISDFYPGTSSDKISESELGDALPGIWKVFAGIFKTSINDTKDFGYVDANSLNGESPTWRSHILGYSENRSMDEWQAMALKIGLDPGLIDKFKAQIQDNIDSVPENRQLIHGDLGFDNLLIDNGKVSAVIDWAQMGYGDWYYDFATIDFWWPGRFGNPKEFADKFGFDIANLDQRKAAYWGRRAFGNINFAVKSQNPETLKWLVDYLPSKVVT